MRTTAVTFLHNKLQHFIHSDNLPCYPSDNHPCSNVVCRRRGATDHRAA